jgi:hypothetical protein
MGFLLAALPALGAAGLALGTGGAAAGTAGTFADLGLAAGVLGGGVSALGSIASGEATAKAASYQAQVAQQNQRLATQNAAMASATGSSQVEAAGIKTKAEVGAIKAAQAASNISVDTGSALDVRSSAAALGELDALTIRSSAEKSVYGYETQAASFAGQAGLEKSIAAQAPIAGDIGAFGSVLSAASGVSSKYASWLQSAGTDNWNPGVVGEEPQPNAYSQGGPSTGVYPALWGS